MTLPGEVRGEHRETFVQRRLRRLLDARLDMTLRR